MPKKLAPQTAPPPEMSPMQLAARCQDKKPDHSHEPFCFELFRRALVEKCSLAWHHLHTHYYPLVRHWVCRRTASDPDTVDDLTQDALTAFWRFYTPDKLARASGLGDVLAYLKSCAFSAVLQMNRRAERAPAQVEWDEEVMDERAAAHPAEESALQHLDARQMWAAIEACCNDERDRLVVRLILVAGVKPGQITEQYPALFPAVADVYRIKRNLLDRLRRDPVLRAMCENEQNEHLVE